MALLVFIAFIGSLLGCAIALAVVVKNLVVGFADNGKKPFTYGLISALLGSLAAFLTSYNTMNPVQVFWLFGGIFFLFGILHILFIHNRYFNTKKNNSNKVLIAEILFGLCVIFFTIIIFSSLQYFLLKDKDFLFYPVLMSALLFFVPLLVFHSFQAAYEIPAPVFPTWQYPVYETIELPEPNRKERILVIAFELAKRETEKHKTYFRVGAPETWILGELFYHFINESNAPENQIMIEYMDAEDEPYVWWFYEKRKWYQVQKILNPEISVRDNGITENTIIVCERKVAAAQLSTT